MKRRAITPSTMAVVICLLANTKEEEKEKPHITNRQDLSKKRKKSNEDGSAEGTYPEMYRDASTQSPAPGPLHLKLKKKKRKIPKLFNLTGENKQTNKCHQLKRKSVHDSRFADPWVQLTWHGSQWPCLLGYLKMTPSPPIRPSGHEDTQCGPSCSLAQALHLSAPFRSKNRETRFRSEKLTWHKKN